MVVFWVSRHVEDVKPAFLLCQRRCSDAFCCLSRPAVIGVTGPFCFLPPIFLPTFPIPRTHTTLSNWVRPSSNLAFMVTQPQLSLTQILCVRSSRSSQSSCLCLCRYCFLCLERGSLPVPPPTTVSLWPPLIHSLRTNSGISPPPGSLPREPSLYWQHFMLTAIKSTLFILLLYAPLSNALNVKYSGGSTEPGLIYLGITGTHSRSDVSVSEYGESLICSKTFAKIKHSKLIILI